MIKTLLLLLLALPVGANDYITKSHCDEMLDILREEPVYIKEQEAQDIYRRCLQSLE